MSRMVHTNWGSLRAGNWMYDFSTGRHSCASFSLWVRIALKRWQEGCEYRLAIGVQAPRDTGLYELCLRTLDLCCNCCANISVLKKTKPKTKQESPEKAATKSVQGETSQTIKKKQKPKNMKIRRVCGDSVTEEAEQLYGTETTRWRFFPLGCGFQNRLWQHEKN